MAKFSVIIPNYNNSQYIAEAIESVIKQTFDGWELIIVDDQSSDNSVEIINEYVKKYPLKIKLIEHEKNSGVSQATITGINNITTDIFGTLDGDDALTPDAVGIMYQAHLDNPDCGLIYSQFMICDRNLKPHKEGYCAEIPKGKTNLEVNMVSHFKTFKLKYYKMTSGYDTTIKRAIDKDISYKMEEVSGLKFVNKPLYFYRKYEIGNLSQGKNTQRAHQAHLKVQKNAVHRRAIYRYKGTIIDSTEGEIPQISLIIPYKPDGGQRDRILEFSLKRYKKLFPEFEICVSENNDENFNKAKAINKAVKKAKHDLLCIADIDALFDRKVVVKSLAKIRDGCVKIRTLKKNVLGGCRALDFASTELLFNSDIPLLSVPVKYCNRRIAHFYCLITRECFNKINGYDENFEGWGYEDTAFFYTLRKFNMLAEIYHPIYHLWHPPAVERNRVINANVKGLRGEANVDRWRLYKNKDTSEQLAELIGL